MPTWLSSSRQRNSYVCGEKVLKDIQTCDEDTRGSESLLNYPIPLPERKCIVQNQVQLPSNSPRKFPHKNSDSNKMKQKSTAKQCCVHASVIKQIQTFGRWSELEDVFRNDALYWIKGRSARSALKSHCCAYRYFFRLIHTPYFRRFEAERATTYE